MKAYGKPLFRWAMTQSGRSLPHEMQLVKYYLLFPWIVLFGLICAAWHTTKLLAVAQGRRLRRLSLCVVRISFGQPLVKFSLGLRESKKRRWDYVQIEWLDGKPGEDIESVKESLQFYWIVPFLSLWLAVAGVLLASRATSHRCILGAFLGIN